MWYYKQKDGTCGGFFYGGCEGNANRFISEEECMARCAHKADPCAIPKVVGPCRALLKRYFYNADTGTCDAFNFGGCMGNTNNFDTLAECQERCNVIPAPDGIGETMDAAGDAVSEAVDAVSEAVADEDTGETASDAEGETASEAAGETASEALGEAAAVISVSLTEKEDKVETGEA